MGPTRIASALRRIANELSASPDRLSVERALRRVLMAMGDEGKVKVTLRNVSDFDSDGQTWYLWPVKLEFQGEVLEDEADRESFKQKLHELLGDFGIPFPKDDKIAYYNDNPGVFGMPSPSVKFGDATFQVKDLVKRSTEGWDEPAYETVEVTPPEGFSLA